MRDQMGETAERADAAGKVDAQVEMLARLSREMIAPFVVWLCKDSAKKVNGRAFLVSAEKITLMTEPSRDETPYSTGWTLEYLTGVLPRTVARELRNKWAPRE
jgi:hypothetical protein